MIQRRLLVVIRTKTPEQALAAAEAVAAGGILSLEVSVTMPDADQVIKALAPRHGLTVGAGGVLSKEQAELALQAEARFLVSPVGDISLVPLCREAGAVSVIGALTPTEILAVHRAGADVVKIFPVDPLGGPRYLRAVLDPLPPLPLMVEGGVTLENLPDYLGLPIRLIALGEQWSFLDWLPRGCMPPSRRGPEILSCWWKSGKGRDRGGHFSSWRCAVIVR